MKIYMLRVLHQGMTGIDFFRHALGKGQVFGVMCMYILLNLLFLFCALLYSALKLKLFMKAYIPRYCISCAITDYSLV